jgi:hypothetical protein
VGDVGSVGHLEAGGDRFAGELEGCGFAGKLKGDNMEGLELESSDAEGVGLEGAQLGSSEDGKIAEEGEGSSMELESAQRGSLRGVKSPRRWKVAMGRSGARGRTAWEFGGW